MKRKQLDNHLIVKSSLCGTSGKEDILLQDNDGFEENFLTSRRKGY